MNEIPRVHELKIALFGNNQFVPYEYMSFNFGYIVVRYK